MYKLIKQLFSLLTTQQRKKFIWMQLLVILAAFGEIIGIASIIPFMTLVGDTNILNEPNYLSNLYANSGFNTELEFVFMVGVFVLIVLVLSSCISIFTIWRLSMFAAQIGTEIGDRLYNFYLKQNWLFHSSINSSELTNKVVNETTRITNGILMPLVTMNARIALAFLMLTGLFIYDPLVATTGVFIFGIAYVFLFIFVRSRLLFNGKKISEIYGARYLLLNEGFGGIKDILLYGRANSFVNRFNNSGMKLAYSLGNNQALTLTPRYFIELIAFAIIIILTLYLILNHQL